LRTSTKYGEEVTFSAKLAFQIMLWEVASRRLSRGDMAAALRLTELAEKFGQLIPAQRVFKGNLLLMLSRHEEARGIWHEVRSSCRADLTPNARYAVLAASANLHAVAGDLAACARDERAAVEVRSSALIKRLLPGPRFIEANDR
jgi:hypothetical protein